MTPDGVTVGALARHSRVSSDDAVAPPAQPLLRQASAAGRAPDDPQPRHDRRFARARRPGRRDDGGAGAVRRHGDRGVRARRAGDRRRRTSSSARWNRHCAPDETRHSSAIFPALPGGAGTAFVEIARRTRRLRALRGRRDRRSSARTARSPALRCAYLSVGDTPLVLDLTEAWADGEQSAAEQARGGVDPQSDLHATADYRRHLAGVLTVRAARQAISAARQSAGGMTELTEQASRARGHADGERCARGTARVAARRTLSDFLRHDLGLTGTHVGCEHGVCGACTVLLDGAPVRSCLIFAVSVDGPRGHHRGGTGRARSRGSGRAAAVCRRCSRRSASATRCSAGSARRAS